MRPNISIRLTENAENEISTRGNNRSATINRDLERLYTLYRRALQETPLTLAEGCLLVDCLNGSLFDATSAPLLWGSVEDGIKLDGLDERWEVDGPAFVAKLRALSAFQAMTLIDASERFWSLPPVERGIEEGVRKCFNIVF